jgi:hypothetical protein
MYLKQFEESYMAWRYGTFNVKEEFVGLLGNKCYTPDNGNGTICEARKSDMETLDPAETGVAKRMFKDLAVSSEISTANSPDDFSKVTSGAGDYYYNSAEDGGVVVFGPEGYVNIEVPVGTYALRDGYYRAEIAIENRGVPGSSVTIQHFSGCDNFTYPSTIPTGHSELIDFPFYYDGAVTCPEGSNEDHIKLQVKGYNTESGDKAIIRSITFYEVQEA